MQIETRSLRGNHVLVHAGNTRLLFPEADIGAVGFVSGHGNRNPAGRPDNADLMALSEDLDVLPHVPEERKIYTTLASGRTRWCWSEVRTLHDLQSTAQPLPFPLAHQESPATHFCIIDGEVAVIADLARMIDCARRPLAEEPSP